MFICVGHLTKSGQGLLLSQYKDVLRKMGRNEGVEGEKIITVKLQETAKKVADFTENYSTNHFKWQKLSFSHSSIRENVT